MKNKSILLATMAMAAAAMSANTESKITPNDLVVGSTGYNPIYSTNPIFFPKKHTVESYRSQQRKAKKRKNRR